MSILLHVLPSSDERLVLRLLLVVPLRSLWLHLAMLVWIEGYRHAIPAKLVLFARQLAKLLRLLLVDVTRLVLVFLIVLLMM